MFNVVSKDLGVVRLLFDVSQFVGVVPRCDGYTVVLLRLQDTLRFETSGIESQHGLHDDILTDGILDL